MPLDDYLGLSTDPAGELAQLMRDWTPKTDAVASLVVEAETLAQEPVNVAARLDQIGIDGRAMATAIDTAIAEAEGFTLTLEPAPPPILDGWMAAALWEQRRYELDQAAHPHEHAAQADLVASLRGDLAGLYARADAGDISDNDHRIDDVRNRLRQAEAELADYTLAALTPAIAAAINHRSQNLVGIDGPSTHTLRRDLRDAIAEVFLDPTQADQVFSLVAEDTPVEIAFAAVTGQWGHLPGGHPADYSDDDKRVVVSLLGIDVPEELSPGDLVGIDELLGVLPNDVVAKLFATGVGFEFAGAVGIGTPASVLPANVSAARQIGGEVELSNRQIGIGFSQTHTVEITATATVAVSAYAGKSTLGKVYKYIKDSPRIPQKVQDLLQRSPLLRGIVKGLPFSISYSRFAGTELSYEATINSDQADALAGGDGSVLPDVFEPMEFAVGNSVLIRGGTIEGTNFALKYKLAYLDETMTDFSGLGFGVTRLDGDRVAIYSGPIEAVERQTFLGLKLIATVGFNNTTELQTREFAYAELDLSTPEGMAAYNEFISGGGVPTQSTGRGVLPAVTETVEVDSQTGFRIGIGSFAAEAELGSYNSDYTVTTYTDGSEVLTETRSYGDAQVQFTAPLRADGSIVFDNSSFAVVVSDANGYTAEALGVGWADEPVDFEHMDQHVQLEFTGAEIAALHVIAQAAVRESALDEDDYLNKLEVPTSRVQMIAAAETPQHVVGLLDRFTSADPHGLLYDLSSLGYEVAWQGDQPVIGLMPGTISYSPAG